MEFVTNLTSHAVGHCIARNSRGEVEVTCVAKATYTWGVDGAVTPVEAEPLRSRDEYRGPERAPVLVACCELMPRKPRVDLLLEGSLAFANPTEQVDVSLELGARVRKTIRVFGDRTWTPGVVPELVPSRPRPIAGLEVSWERSFGGADPESPATFEPRNPAGQGMRRDARHLVGTRLPNFEDPAHLISSPTSRPGPVGFGAVAAHWMPRSRLAGTYDERWKAERYPLLPEDFSPAFFNAAPTDQQVDRYLPGEELRLLQMTPQGRERIVLPAFDLPITFVSGNALVDVRAQVDTIVVDPARRRLSLLARAALVPTPNVLAFQAMVVGTQSRGMHRALQTGKQYVRLRPPARLNQPTRTAGE